LHGKITKRVPIFMRLKCFLHIIWLWLRWWDMLITKDENDNISSWERMVQITDNISFCQNICFFSGLQNPHSQPCIAQSTINYKVHMEMWLKKKHRCRQIQIVCTVHKCKLINRCGYHFLFIESKRCLNDGFTLLTSL